MSYELFFFKENNRFLDVKELFDYFNKKHFFKTIIEEDLVEFKYYNPRTSLAFSLFLTKKTRVPDIYRLNPKYLDLDFCLTLSPMLSSYNLNCACEIVFELTQKFNMAIYNIFFQDVSVYNKDLIFESYYLYRNNYREKNPLMFNNLQIVPKEKLTNVLNYLDEKDNLDKYYKESNIYFPEVSFIKSKTTGKIYVATEFKFETLYAFITDSDILFYRDQDYLRALYLDEVLSIVGKHTVELPGFGHKLLVLTKAGAKKFRKIISKADLTEVCDTFDKIDLQNIVDFK